MSKTTTLLDMFTVLYMKKRWWPGQFHLDIDFASVSSDPIQNNTFSAYGTYFHDEKQTRFAAFLTFIADENHDNMFYKFIYRHGTLYQLDLATGECKRSNLSGKSVSDVFPNMKYEGMEYLRRNAEFFRVETWKFQQNISTPFGYLSTRMKYHQTADELPPADPETCYDIPRLPRSSNSNYEPTQERHQPFRFQVNVDMPDLSHPFSRTLSQIYELSCFVSSFEDVDLDFVFDIPDICTNTQ